jgi:hypothetical protein
MKTKVMSGVIAFVVVWTILIHAQSHWSPILAYPLYPGEMVSLLVTGGHGGTLTQDKIGFAAELVVNLLAYLLATFLLFRATRFSE